MGKNKNKHLHVHTLMFNKAKLIAAVAVAANAVQIETSTSGQCCYNGYAMEHAGAACHKNTGAWCGANKSKCNSCAGKWIATAVAATTAAAPIAPAATGHCC